MEWIFNKRNLIFLALFLYNFYEIFNVIRFHRKIHRNFLFYAFDTRKMIYISHE